MNAELKDIIALERVVTQSPPETSRRVWSAFCAVATAVLAAALAFWSKATDPRPMR